MHILVNKYLGIMKLSFKNTFWHVYGTVMVFPNLPITNPIVIDTLKLQKVGIFLSFMKRQCRYHCFTFSPIVLHSIEKIIWLIKIINVEFFADVSVLRFHESKILIFGMMSL